VMLGSSSTTSTLVAPAGVSIMVDPPLARTAPRLLTGV
jgi:hypothetical protein